MATAATATEAKDTECSICHEEFTLPKLLTCGHLLCRHCLQSLLNAHRNALCPLCHHLIVDPDTRQGQSVESIVDAFPTDVGMKIWAENERLLKGDHKCQSCVTQAASSLCLHCRDFLCSSCAAMHGRLSLSRHHSVESLTSLTAEKLAASCSTPCQQHPQELSRLYCVTHQASICLLCASKHRNCPDVKDLEERGEETRALWTEVVTKLSSQEATLDQANQELDDLLVEEEKKEQAALAQLDDIFDQVESAVKRRRVRMKESTLSSFSGTKKSIQKRRAHLLRKRGTVTTHRTVAERGKRLAALGDVSEMVEAMKKHADDFDTNALLSKDAQVITIATFVMNPEFYVSNVEEALLEPGQVKVTPASVAAQVGFLSFHDNCGENIVLSNKQQTAERKGNAQHVFGGIVVSRQAMQPHRLYEVHLDEVDADRSCYMWVGAATTDPGSMTLPDENWTSAVVFCNDQVQVHDGQTIRTTVGAKLKDMPRGTLVGVMVDGSGHLHLYIDGKNQGQAEVVVSQPCFAFFDVCGRYRKVTTQPVRTVV